MNQNEPPRIGRYTVFSSDPNLTIRSRRMLRYAFLESSLTHARGAKEVEALAKADPDKVKADYSAYRGQHFAGVTGSITAVVQFLESTINELLSECTRPMGDPSEYISNENRRLLAVLWNWISLRRLGSMSALDKYQAALELIGVDLFDKGADPFQSVAVVIEIRNAFVHYVPEEAVTYTRVPDLDVDQRIKKKLIKYKLRTNPIVGKQAMYFPDQILSADLCVWSLKSSIDFASQFLTKIGLERWAKNLESRLPKVVTLSDEN